MDLTLFTSRDSQVLMQKMRELVFAKKQDVSNIFNSSIIFINNQFAKSGLEQFFIRQNQEFFLGNIHFIEWGVTLSSVLEVEDEISSVFINWHIIISLFLENLFHNKELIFKDINEKYNSDNFLPLAQYYYKLFTEYEVYLSLDATEWVAYCNKRYEKEFPNKIFKEHYQLYQKFWEWFKKHHQKLNLAYREQFTYPYKRILKKQYQLSKDVHIFLPLNVLPSQIKVLYETFTQHSIYVYILKKPVVPNLVSYKNYMENFIAEEWKKHSSENTTNIIMLDLQKNNTNYSQMQYKKYNTISSEYQGLLYNIQQELRENMDLINNYAILIPNSNESQKQFLLNFAPYKQKLPYHVLFKQEVIKPFNFYSIILSLFSFIKEGYNLSSLENFINNPIIMELWNITELDNNKLLVFLKKKAAWGDSSYLAVENTISYNLLELLLQHYIDINVNMEEISFPIGKLLDTMDRMKELSFLEGNRVLCVADIEDFKSFLEFLVPSLFWTEFDDKYLRKDILDVLDVLEFFIQCIYQKHNITTNLFFSVFEYLNKSLYKSEKLEHVKNQGISVASLQSLDSLPIQGLFISEFSDEQDLLSKQLFEEQSMIEFLEPSIFNMVQYSVFYKFLDIIFESKKVKFSYHTSDFKTLETLNSHFLYSYLDINEVDAELVALPSGVLEIATEDLNKEYGFMVNKKTEFHIMDICKFLDFPRKFSLTQLYQKNRFFEQFSSWEYKEYLFPWSNFSSRNAFIWGFYESHAYEGALQQENFTANKQGILRQTPYTKQQLILQYTRISNLYDYIQATYAEYSLFHKVFFGDIMVNQQIQYKIFPLYQGKGYSIMGDLSFIWLKDNPEELHIIVPIYPKLKDIIPKKILLSCFCIFSFFEKQHLTITMIGYSDINSNELKSLDFSYNKTESIEYLDTLISYLNNGIEQPLSYKFLKSFFNDRHKKLLEENIWTFFNSTEIQNFLEIHYKDANIEENILLDITEWKDTFVQEIKDCYKVLLDSYNNKLTKVI